MNWFQRTKLKANIAYLKRNRNKWNKQDNLTKEQIIESLMGLSDMITLYQDDEQTIPETKESLMKKSVNELTDLFEEILNEANKMI